MLGSPPQPSSRVPEGPARPIACEPTPRRVCWRQRGGLKRAPHTTTAVPHSLAHRHAVCKRRGRDEDDWLKPEHASPLPLQRRGLRRAKALYCQICRCAPCPSHLAMVYSPETSFKISPERLGRSGTMTLRATLRGYQRQTNQRYPMRPAPAAERDRHLYLHLIWQVERGGLFLSCTRVAGSINQKGSVA
jgi:hypothetical protein